MDKNEKGSGFMDLVKDGLGYISKIISASIFPPIVESAQVIMNNLEERLLKIEKRVLKNVCSLLIIGLGGVFLLFALFFLLIEYFGWTKAVAFFSIGIIVFVIGLLLKLGESES